MSLHDVLLSLLRKPMSGTELVELFQSSIRHFWQADLSQIYRALETLEEKGAVRSRSVPSTRGPARRVYRLTAAGRRRLTDWVRRQPHIPPFKFEYLAQLFSVTAEEHPRERAVEILTALRNESRASLAVLEGIDAGFTELPGYPERLPGYVFYPWLTLRHGIHRRRALVEWIDESLKRLESRPGEIDAEDPDAIAALGALLAEFGDVMRADGPQVETGSGQEKS